MDRSIEFLSAAESLGYSGSSNKALPPSGFVLKASNMFTQIAMFENLITTLCSSYIGYNRLLPVTTISAPLTSEERRNVNKEILLFIGNISAEMKELNRFLERTNDDSFQYQHNKQVVSTLVVKLQSFMVANDKMQKLHKQNNISPYRLMTGGDDHSKASKDEHFGSSSSLVDSNSISSSNTAPAGDSSAQKSASGFSSRYVDEIAPQSKMNEYKSIAAKHKASLLKEAKVLQTRFNDDLEESIRMEQEVNNISKLLAQFVVMIDAQSEIVVDVNEFSKQSTRTVKQAGQELQFTLDRTQSHQWSMVLLILGFAVLLLALDFLTP